MVLFVECFFNSLTPTCLTMRNFLFPGFFFFFFYHAALAQEYTAVFEDGSEVDYEIINDHTDAKNRFNINLNLFSFADVSQPLVVSYFLPDAFSLNARAWYYSAGLDGLIFLSSYEKPSSVAATIKRGYSRGRTLTDYRTEIDVTRKTYFGIHTGYTYKDFSGGGSLGALLEEPGFVVHEIVIGLGLTRGKFMEMIVHTVKKPVRLKGTTTFSLYADALIYPIRRHSELSEHTPESINEISTPIGFRTYLEGKSSFWGRREFGMAYQLGVGYFVLKEIRPIASVGLYAGF